MDGNQPRDTVFRDPSAEKITARAVIIGFLTRIHDSRSLVTVTIPGARTQYLSTILDVNTKQGYLLLDELKREDGHKQLMRHGKFHARASVKGIEINFVSVIDTVGSTSGIGFYKIPIPQVLYYHQRRAFYRAHVSIALSVPVSLTRALSDGDVSGLLRDISVGGIGARIEPRRSGAVTKGELMPTCAITLPGGASIYSALEVRYIDHGSRQKVLRLGGRFIDLNRQQQKIIERFVVELDRELMRKMPKG